MNNKSRSQRRLIPAFGLALVASLAMSAFLAGSASALSLSGTSSFTGSSGALTLNAEGWPKRTCSSSANYYNVTTSTSGEVETTLTGCTLEIFGGKANCTTAGQSAGVIKLAKQTYTLVYLDAAKTKFGMKLSPASGSVVAEFNCGGASVKWTGSVLGQITSPALGVTSHTGNLQFTASGTTQTYQQVEGAGFPYHLSESRSGGAAVNLAISEDQALSTAGTFTFQP